MGAILHGAQDQYSPPRSGVRFYAASVLQWKSKRSPKEYYGPAAPIGADASG
jgi:hypothetical protein